MAILLNKVINAPLLIETSWDPFFNGEYWIDKENALKFKDRIEVIYNDSLVAVNENNINTLFETKNSMLKLGGIILHSKNLKVGFGKECFIKYNNTILTEGVIDSGLFLKNVKISDSELELKIIKRWVDYESANEDLKFNLSTLRVELDNNPTSSKKIILSFKGKNPNEQLNCISIKNMQNPMEIASSDDQLILKTQTDEDGEEFTVQVNSIITTDFVNI
jgi:hypothetical protein